ncbi:MAG: ribosome recycling factor [Patescibacteria group bacterium]
MQPWIEQFTKLKQGALEALRSEFATLRTGRASGALVEHITVDAYGSTMRIREIASITTPDARTIMIQPWDRSLSPMIVKALETASLGIMPNASEEGIRLTMPQMSEERRKELVKTMGRMTEEVRVKVRRARDEAWGEIQEAARKSEITEDDKFMLKEKLQKEIDTANDEIERLRRQKEESLS